MNEEHNQELQPNQEGDALDTKEYSTDAESSKNTIIIAVLAIVVVVLALMYMWGSSKALPIEEQPPLPPDQQTEELRQVSTSDELRVIESDLMITDMETLDDDMEEIEFELESELKS